MKTNSHRVASNWLQPSNTPAVCQAAATYAGGDAWVDRPPVSHGFAPTKSRVLRAPGIGFGHAFASLRREVSFHHPDVDRPATLGWCAAEAPSCTATPPARDDSPEARMAAMVAMAAANLARAKADADLARAARVAEWRASIRHRRLHRLAVTLRERREAAEAEANRLARLGASPWG